SSSGRRSTPTAGPTASTSSSTSRARSARSTSPARPPRSRRRRRKTPPPPAPRGSDPQARNGENVMHNVSKLLTIGLLAVALTACGEKKGGGETVTPEGGGPA